MISNIFVHIRFKSLEYLSGVHLCDLLISPKTQKKLRPKFNSSGSGRLVTLQVTYMSSQRRLGFVCIYVREIPKQVPASQQLQLLFLWDLPEMDVYNSIQRNSVLVLDDAVMFIILLSLGHVMVYL